MVEVQGKGNLVPAASEDGQQSAKTHLCTPPKELQHCPQCSSRGPFYRDGMRYTAQGQIQRFLCRDCGHRFSEKGPKPPSRPLKENLNWHLKAPETISKDRRIRAILQEAKNLTTVEETKTLAGEIETTQQDIKGSLAVYAAKQITMGLNEMTILRRVQILGQLRRRGANLFNPTSAWRAIDAAAILDREEEKTWADGSKALAAQAYRSFCKIMRIAIPEDLNFRKWKAQSKVHWFPLETEVDQLVAACRLKMATFLLLLKECGCRSGEAWRLKWKDIDAEHGIVTINCPEKNGLPRQLKVSSKLVAMLNSFPKTSEKIWNGNIHSWRSSFIGQRNRIAVKLQNPRIKDIHFHSLRHFFASMLYRKTLNLVEVQQKLGHRNINSTICYTHLVSFDSDEYLHAHAQTLQEEDALIDAGYEFIRYSEENKVAIYRKRK